MYGYKYSTKAKECIVETVYKPLEDTFKMHLKYFLKYCTVYIRTYRETLEVTGVPQTEKKQSW